MKINSIPHILELPPEEEHKISHTTETHEAHQAWARNYASSACVDTTDWTLKDEGREEHVQRVSYHLLRIEQPQ